MPPSSVGGAGSPRRRRPLRPDWPRLHETDGVLWDEPFQRDSGSPGADFESYKGRAGDERPRASGSPGVDREGTRGPPGGDGRRSVLMGSGVPVDLTFENRSRTRSPRGVLGDREPVEFLNFGVAGYRIDQLADVVLTRLEAFEPDVVVMVLNDLALNPNWSRHIAWLLQEDRDLGYDFIRREVDLAGVDGGRAEVVSARLASQRDAVIEGSLGAGGIVVRTTTSPWCSCPSPSPRGPRRSRTPGGDAALWSVDSGSRCWRSRMPSMIRIRVALAGALGPASDRRGARIMAERLLDELSRDPIWPISF